MGGVLNVQGTIRLRHKRTDSRNEAINNRRTHALLVSSRSSSSSTAAGLPRLAALTRFPRGDNIERSLSAGLNGDSGLRLEGRGRRLNLACGLWA